MSDLTPTGVDWCTAHEATVDPGEEGCSQAHLDDQRCELVPIYQRRTQ